MLLNEQEGLSSTGMSSGDMVVSVLSKFRVTIGRRSLLSGTQKRVLKRTNPSSSKRRLSVEVAEVADANKFITFVIAFHAVQPRIGDGGGETSKLIADPRY